MDYEKFYLYFLFFIVGILSITTVVYYQFFEGETIATGYVTQENNGGQKSVFSFGYYSLAYNRRRYVFFWDKDQSRKFGSPAVNTEILNETIDNPKLLLEKT